MKTKYKIIVKTLGGAILTFSVNDYTTDDSSMICFTDMKTGDIQKFHSSNCEIKEVRE